MSVTLENDVKLYNGELTTSNQFSRHNGVGKSRGDFAMMSTFRVMEVELTLKTHTSYDDAYGYWVELTLHHKYLV